MKKFIFFISAAVLLFAGCLNYEQNVKLKRDGSGSMNIKVWKHTDSTTVGFDTVYFNRDSIAKKYESPFLNITSVDVVSDSVDSTITATLSLTFNSIDSLNFVPVFENYDFSYIDGAPGQKVFSQFIPQASAGFGYIDSNLTVSYTYTFSGEIISHNAQTINGNTLTWKYKHYEIGQGKTISVTIKPYKLDETPIWIYVAAGTVLLIVIFFLFKKKRD